MALEGWWVGGRDGRGAWGALLALGKDKPCKFTGRMGVTLAATASPSPRLALPCPRIFIRGFDPTLATTPSPAPGQIRESLILLEAECQHSRGGRKASCLGNGSTPKSKHGVPPLLPRPSPSQSVHLRVYRPHQGPGLAQAVEQSWRGIAHSTDEKTEHLPRARPCACSAQDRCPQRAPHLGRHRTAQPLCSLFAG